MKKTLLTIAACVCSVYMIHTVFADSGYRIMGTKQATPKFSAYNKQLSEVPFNPKAELDVDTEDGLDAKFKPNGSDWDQY